MNDGSPGGESVLDMAKRFAGAELQRYLAAKVQYLLLYVDALPLHRNRRTPKLAQRTCVCTVQRSSFASGVSQRHYDEALGTPTPPYSSQSFVASGSNAVTIYIALSLDTVILRVRT